MVGLNDKDSKVQEINTLVAKKLVAEIIGACTITNGFGSYVHDDGTVVFEENLIVSILDFDGGNTLDVIKSKVEQIKHMLNQEAVAYQVEEINSQLL